jgi:hypothetical protein
MRQSGRTWLISARKLAAAHTVGVVADGPDKKPHAFRGVLVANLLKNVSGQTAEFVGADEYRQALPLAKLLKNRAVLVRTRSGMWQLVSPGFPPHSWVDWLVEIDIR